MRPPLYMRSVVDRNVAMRHIPVISFSLSLAKQGPNQKTQGTEGSYSWRCLAGAL